MILYHGSNVAVKEPKIIISDRKLDFGTGFYLTSDFDQAKRWAVLTTDRRKSGVPVISVYTFNNSAMDILKVKLFQKPDSEWLKYAAWNRNDPNAADDYDLVAGPVANDKTSPVLAAFFAGIYDEDETIKRLMPEKLKDQYALKTQAALDNLEFSKVIYVR
jgi:hypothetical protein